MSPGDESSVRVAVRIRPQIARELIEMCRICTHVTPDEPQVFLGSDKAFTYDHVFDIASTQEDVYATCVESLIEGCFDGYNATVLAYGQTGSGKTYSMGTGLDMETGPETIGIIPRAVSHLFAGIDERRSRAKEKGITPPEFKITAHFMELYNEEVIDLFDPGVKGVTKGNIKIHEDSDGGIYVSGISTRTVSVLEESLQCLRVGALSRTTGSTNMNAQSSRSHAIFTLLIKQQRLIEDQDFESKSDTPEFETLTAKFHFVDLAGSERLKRTGATGDRAREGISINCGLLALGNVISALGDASKKASHVPYRDSKLTRLLQDSLGGNSRTLMIACVSPSDTDFMETLNTLKYANRARNIKNRITVNLDKTSKTISALRQEIQALQIELIEYKQGKRVIGEDGVEGVNDMFHENQMLASEAGNLSSRVKALQETVEMLTAKNTQLLAEKAIAQWAELGDDSDMAGIVRGYLEEIEKLRAKLLESENLCHQLRRKCTNRANVMRSTSYTPIHNSIQMTGSITDYEVTEEAQSITDLIEEAKKDLRHDFEEVTKKKKEDDFQLQPVDEDEDESSDESAEDKENYNEELAELTSEMSIKQKLIESLEATQRRLETMKYQYEEKLNMLMNRIKATQDERDKVLANIKHHHSTGSDDHVKKVRSDYQQKLTQMEEQLKKLKVAQKEHTKLMRERTQHERQLRALKTEVTDMKKTKVKLMNSMKEESNRAKKEDLKKRKEIAQLRKEQRKKENYIRNLEADNRLKNTVLKRKTEELTNLKRIPRKGLSNVAAGKFRKKMVGEQLNNFSPKIAKQKWHSLEQSINKVAFNKQTVSSLERDMDRWLRERESLSRQLEKIIRRRERVDPIDAHAYHDLNEQVEACKANIDYIHENITECQENIMSMEENKEPMEMLDPNRVSHGLNMDEMQYLISKLITMSANQATIAAQRQAAIGEQEGKIKQLEQTMSVQEQLLAHVLQDNDLNVYHLMSSLVAGDNTSGSTESSRSTSPVDDLLLGTSASMVESYDSLKRRSGGDKARRRTATTQDMLFTNGDRVMSTSATTLHASVGFVPYIQDGVSLSAPPTLDPRMTSSLESTFGPPCEPIYGRTLDGFPRVISTPHTLKNQSTNRCGPSASVLLTTHKNIENPTSPRIIRKNLATLSTSLVNYNRQGSLEVPSDVTPPTSPIAYRRNVSKDENVFSRLLGSREAHPNTGTINPHSGRVNQRSVLACTHIAQGHSKAVLSVFATDDKIFSSSKDRTAKVWDLVRGEEVMTLAGHPNNVTCVKYSEDLRICFTVSSSSIKLWDLRESPTKCIKILSSSGLTCHGPTSSSNSRTLQMPPGETQINDIAVSHSSNILYSAAGNIVRIWDLRKYMSVGKLSGGHQAAIMCLAVDSTLLKQDVVVTGSKDHYIKVFDVNSNDNGLVSPRRTLDPPHYDGIQSLALYGDNLFSGSRDTCIKKWDLTRGEHVQSLNNAHKDWICALCFLPGGQIVLSGCRGGVIKMWGADSCHMLGELKAHSAPINAITTNSTTIFTASNDCTIGLWRMRTSYDASPEMSDSTTY